MKNAPAKPDPDDVYHLSFTIPMSEKRRLWNDAGQAGYDGIGPYARALLLGLTKRTNAT